MPWGVLCWTNHACMPGVKKVVSTLCSFLTQCLILSYLQKLHFLVLYTNLYT